VSEIFARPTLPRWLIFVMALACGVGVSNLYFPQAVTPLIASDLAVSRPAATIVATLAQFGYAVGIFFLVPLGDRLPRRWLIAGLFGVVAIGLLIASGVQSLFPLYVLSLVIGVATVVPQILIPMGADFAAPGTTSRMVSTLQAGLLGGVLLSRAFGGLLGQFAGWRAPYVVSGVLAALIAVALVMALPTTPIKTRTHYPALIASSVRIFVTEPDLRRSCLYQALMFAGFSAAWTSLTLLLTGHIYGFGTGVVGVIALVSAASVILVPIAGRIVDRRGSDIVSLVCILGLVCSAAILLVGQVGGWLGVAGLVVGLLVLDVSVQSSQIANQSRIFALHPDSRSRLNSVYMSSVFLGGAAGSALGAVLFERFGWSAVCGFVFVVAAAALVRHLAHRSSQRMVTEQ
jgi:predicted MFS family arabinose efflux permease